MVTSAQQRSTKLGERSLRLVAHELRAARITPQVDVRRAGFLDRLEYRKLALMEAVCAKLHSLLHVRFELFSRTNLNYPSPTRFLLTRVVLPLNIKLLKISNSLLKRSILLNERRLAYLRLHQLPLQFGKPLGSFAAVFNEFPQPLGSSKKVTNVRRHKR